MVGGKGKDIARRRREIRMRRELQQHKNDPSSPVSWLKNNPTVEDAEAFIKNHPDALMGNIYDEVGGNVPLHHAIRSVASDEVILLLLNACPQVAAVEDEYGRLPLHYATFKKCSEKVIKALINAHPGAASVRNPVDGCQYMPLHMAIVSRASDEVILLLLEACPLAAKELFSKRLPLHWAIDSNKKGTTCSEEVIMALLNAHPGAASERNQVTGNLPLHDAVNNKKISEGIIMSLFNAYPQAAFEEMKDGRLLFEICLERKASDDLMREICKVCVRVDGLLLLGFFLTKRSSDDIVLAVLKAYPEAAGKRFSTKFDECILPLHIAYEDNHSEAVKDALRDAYPDAENENPFETTHQLHKLLENKPFDQLDCDSDGSGDVDVRNLIEKYPEAARKRGRDGRLPLHIAIYRMAPWYITDQLFEAYPQAGEEKMKNGRLPIEVFANHDYVSSAEYVHVKEDLKWLRNYPSVGDAKAFIENYPDALMGKDGRNVPLHEAIECRVSDEMILLLLEACPQAAATKDLHGALPLHYAMNRRGGMCSEEVKKALLNAHPGAASEKNKWTRNLPLHDAVNKNASEGIIMSLLNAYPQAAGEKMKDGRFLFEIFLERKDAHNLMREICKVRVDGLLPLGVVLTERSSDDIVLAVLEAYPEAAGKRFSTKFDECILPLNIANEDNHSEPVQKALRRAYPDAEKENPFKTTYKLHKVLENESLDFRAGHRVYDLIKKYPEAAGKRGRDGRLPLHIAIDRMAHRYIMNQLFEAYPQAGKEKMKDGRLPIEVFVEQKESDDWSQSTLTYTAFDLLRNDMPVSIEDGTPREHSGSWHACISHSTKTATDAVREVLHSGRNGGGFGKHIHALAEARDAKGRPALGLASKESLEVIYEYLLFCGRYKLQIGPPEYRTATSVVLRAQDLAEQADYGVIFDKADKDEDGKLDRKELSSIAGSIGLDPDLFLNDSGKTTTTISKEEFVAACKRQLGDGPREVVIKLMQSKDHWERECNARKDYELESKYVVSALPNIPSEEAIAKAVRNGEGGLGIIKKKYLDNIELGIYAIVMDAADRNMLQMFNQEQPKLDTIRVMLRQVFEAVQHVHEKNLMHGDIKMVNIVRFRIDNKLRLIDLDASAEISVVEEESFAGAKFSSAILPPEMIERIETDEKLEEFNKYWEDVDDDLFKKVAPKPYKKHGVERHYVVKSFRTEDGKPVEEDLPFTLVEASRSIDLWSLGVLAFTLLTGESLIPSTRDDDCASGAAMHFLYSWGTRPEKLIELFNKIPDPAGRDLVSKLLQFDGTKRPPIATLLKDHYFFNQQNEDLLEKLTDINTALKDAAKNREDDRALLERMEANIEVIKKLSYESQSELLRTRHVLLKGIFEATEVRTPTTFIILNNELPPAADPSDEEAKNKILEIVANEDGSGVSMKTKYASLTATAEGVDINLEGDLKEYRDQVEAGIKWANTIKDIGMNVFAGEIGTAFDIIKEKIIKEKLVGDEMYLYLIDELTGEPVRAKGWPIVITTPSELVPKLLPLMQLGMRGLSFCSGTLGLVRMFGYPAPKVPKAWSKGAQESVELLKQESSVEGFSVVHDEVKRGSEEEKSVRGASLREFVDFLGKEDPGLKDGKTGHFAGLQRIGDPDQGTALWTVLTDQSAIESALKKRANEREEEERKLSAASNGHNQMTAKTEKESEGLGREEISEEDGRLPVGTTSSSNERNRSMAKGTVVTADEINVSNDSRNPVVISEEIAEFIKATAAAAATAAAKEAVSAAASSEQDCCAIM
eukprot:scaffold4399_cov75-Skeletonema_dohrnii-CCMP3373.AAC.4